MNLAWLIVIVLLIFWLFGYAINIAGDLIHLLLLVILAVGLYALATGRRIE